MADGVGPHHRSQLAQYPADRALHRDRRSRRRHDRDDRASDGRARRPLRRQRADRDRRAGDADHGRLGGAIRRRHRHGRPRHPGAPPQIPQSPQIGLCRTRALPRGTETLRSRVSRRCRDRFRSRDDWPAAARFRYRPQTFKTEIAKARTFGFVADVKKLWAAGFALGSSLENSVAIDGDRVLNPEGLRYRDEFVRHKALDAIGDLALAGAPILGAYHAHRPGHALNAAVLAALFADKSNYEIVEGDAAPRRRALAPPSAGSRRRSPPMPTENRTHSRRICRRRRFRAIFPCCCQRLDRRRARSTERRGRAAGGEVGRRRGLGDEVSGYRTPSAARLSALRAGAVAAGARGVARGLLHARGFQPVRGREIQDGGRAGRAGEPGLRPGPGQTRRLAIRPKPPRNSPISARNIRAPTGRAKVC